MEDDLKKPEIVQMNYDYVHGGPVSTQVDARAQV
jgi:hypothetical protein